MTKPIVFTIATGMEIVNKSSKIIGTAAIGMEKTVMESKRKLPQQTPKAPVVDHKHLKNLRQLQLPLQRPLQQEKQNNNIWIGLIA